MLQRERHSKPDCRWHCKDSRATADAMRLLMVARGSFRNPPLARTIGTGQAQAILCIIYGSRRREPGIG